MRMNPEPGMEVTTLESLPSEVLVSIFLYLDYDSLLCLEGSCSRFLSLVRSSLLIWRRKVRGFLRQNSLQYLAYRKISREASELRRLYRCLRQLEANILAGRCTQRELLCLESEVKGRKVVRSPDWDRSHNYKGVYDMILDRGRICASVYDTIQVWDVVDSFQMTHLFTKEILDQDGTQTTCFTLYDDYLVCGSENGYIKLIDLASEKCLTRARLNSNYISDVKAKDGMLLSVDWLGLVTEWRVEPGPLLRNVTRQGAFTVPRLLERRDVERLIDFNSEYLVATIKSHLTCYEKAEFKISFPLYSDIFCVSIIGSRIAFGCKGDSATAAPVAGIADLDFEIPRVVYFKTQDNDPVISLHFSPRFLFLGDVNGEIHVIDIRNIQFTEKEIFVDFKRRPPDDGVESPSEQQLQGSGCRFVTTLRSHAYSAFIWSIQSDGYRLFSGDENGKILVHDFLQFNQDKSLQPD